MATKRPALDVVASARRHIARILKWTSGFDVSDFEAEQNDHIRYACERAFIAIGEALNDLRAKVDLVELVPEGPWADPIRFRHFLAHDYDDAAIPALVWDTIKINVPELDAALEKVEQALRSKDDLSI